MHTLAVHIKEVPLVVLGKMPQDYLALFKDEKRGKKN